MPPKTPQLVPIADTDIFLIGLRRSGIHAIISWLIPHLNGVTRFVNDPVFEPGLGGALEGRPLRFYYAKNGRCGEIVAPGCLRQVSDEVGVDDAGAFVRQTHFLLRPFARTILKQLKRFRKIHPVRPSLIPYAEQPESGPVDSNLFALENLTPSEFARVYPKWRESDYLPHLAAQGYAPARRTLIILIAREPWNQLASLIKNPPSKPPRIITPEQYKAKWLEYSAEYVGETSVLADFGEVLPISYPRWFQDATYRAELAASLGAPPSDFGLDVVADFGGGSSFEGQGMSGRAQAMKVTERWKAYAEHPLMVALCSDPVVQARSEKIFGCASPMTKSI